MKLDGIAGINPLQIFKIEKDKLPKGYQSDDIVFVVKKEKHNITSGQDWTTEISGQLMLLDTKMGESFKEENNEINFELPTTKLDNTLVVNEKVFVEVDGELVDINDVIENPDFDPEAAEEAAIEDALAGVLGTNNP